MYSQIDCVAMGRTLGSMLANIFVAFHEDRVFEDVPRATLYYRYVDDTFALFGDKHEAIKFFDQLESLHPSLGFTVKKESNGSLPFLDIFVERSGNVISTSVYQKPTFSDLYTDWKSLVPKSRKINLLSTLVYRALVIYSPEKLERGIT